MNQDTSTAACVARLYASHQPWLLRRIRRWLSCPQDAEDIAADTFVQVIQHTDPLAIDEPQAFLTTIARRLTTRLWRRRELEKAYLERLQQLPRGSCPSAEEQLAALQALQQLDAWMRPLAVNVRLAFLYRVLDDMDHAEIARRLRVSVRTVGRYLSQAALACAKADLTAGPGQP